MVSILPAGHSRASIRANCARRVNDRAMVVNSPIWGVEISVRWPERLRQSARSGVLPPATHNTGSRANFRFDVRAPSCPDRLLPQPLAQDPAQLADDYPGASSDAVAATAYALACLFEAHWAFSVQGVVDTRRQQQAERAALLLLDHLEAG
jgi:hypothetical protein